jgi:CBS domain containing-hemolysin-like protein
MVFSLRTFAGLLIVCFMVAVLMAQLVPPLQFIWGTGGFAVGCAAFLVFVPLALWLRHEARTGQYEAKSLTYYNSLHTEAPAGMPAELMENALHLREICAADCMAPRNSVVYISVQSSVEALRQLFVESHLSRIIVTGPQGLDDVRGYVHVQQIFDQPVTTIRKMLLPIGFVQATLPVNELLNRFVRKRTNIACVRDENTGQLIGIVTLENALEQLFGEIDDEHD